MTSCLFVCTGNICRSPTAEAVFIHLVKRKFPDITQEITTDSAGTHGYHIGEPPDKRARDIASKHGVDMSYIRARKFDIKDFDRFDYIFAMDNSHYTYLKGKGPKESEHKIHLFLDFLEGFEGADVPDPYYGGLDGFEQVFRLINDGCEAIISAIFKS